VSDGVALWVVVAAAVPGVLALVAAVMAWVRLGRVRRAQTVLLPDGVPAGVVDRQAALQASMDRLDAGLAELRDLVDTQAARLEAGLRSAVRFQSVVRYDAYRDMGGGQSWSLALLDETGTGAVVTCLHARDHARVYLKELVAGQASQRLSPEEDRAVAQALHGPAAATRARSEARAAEVPGT
jgi:hypothetical protein